MTTDATTQTMTSDIRPQQKQVMIIRTAGNFLVRTGLFVNCGWIENPEGGFLMFARPKFLFEDMFAGKEPHHNFCFVTQLPSEETLASAEILQEKTLEIANDILMEYVCGNRTLVTFEQKKEEATDEEGEPDTAKQE